VTCKEITDFLLDYLNGELAEANRVIFEEHLAECPDCVAYVQSYEMTVKLAQAERETGPSQLPQDLIRAILAARKGMSCH
jgi:predicted anti-sigma-YlaC factor YlaD